MYLYKLEVQMEDRKAALIIMGDSDREVMDEAEALLSKHYIGAPAIREIVMLEKRRANKGAGYVIET